MVYPGGVFWAVCHGWIFLILFYHKQYGPIAQLGERSVRIRKVEGSSPFGSSTIGASVVSLAPFFVPIYHGGCFSLTQVCIYDSLMFEAERTESRAQHPKAKNCTVLSGADDYGR